MPAALRELLDAEIAAGNNVIEVASCHPAPPAGAYFALSSSLKTALPAGLTYYNRNNSSYSGEITDAQRFFFLLEPPAPPPPEPDMDAIRVAHSPSIPPPDHESLRAEALQTIFRSATAGDPTYDTDLVARFRRSMEIDYEKWHDGIGYDLTLIDSATPDERETIEKILLARDARDWRDVEALAVLKTPAARKALKDALGSSKPEVSMAVLNHAPELVSEAARTRTLIAALRTGDFYNGLTQALDQVEKFHPPKIIAELFRCALEREGGVACSFASALLVIHGKKNCRPDWTERPLILRFNNPHRDERESVFLDLCEKIGEPAAPFAEEVRKRRQKRVCDEETQALLAKTLVPIFEVDIDTTRELLIYREPKRSATVTCTFEGKPRLRASTLSDWISSNSKRTQPMTGEEKAETLNRIMDYCRNRHGLLDLKREE